MKKRLISLCLCGVLLFLNACADKNENDQISTSQEETNSTELTKIESEPISIDPKYEKMSLEEKLIDINTWEKEGHPQNLIIFNEKGEGFLKNYGILYKMNWKLEDNKLITKVEIREDLVTEVVYKIETSDNYFLITNIQSELSSKYYFEGTQSTILPKDGVKDEKIFGKWLPEDEELYGYQFSDDEGISGKFSQKDKDAKIISKFKWTVYDYQIYIYYENGPQYVYEYMITGNTLIFYRKGKSNIVYHKTA